MNKESSQPPKLGIWLLRKVYDEDRFDEVAGDLQEMYIDRLRPSGKRIASLYYFKDVILSFRNIGLKRKKQTMPTSRRGLFNNYLKIGLRSLVRNKSYSFINIFGLAVGIASGILILLWVQFEYSYDRFFPRHDYIYQLKLNVNNNGIVATEDNMCLPVYMTLRNADSRIKTTCITTPTYGRSLKYKNKDVEKEVMAVSTEFLEMFGIHLVVGTTHSLDDPHSILLSESTAREFFGDSDPINQLIKINHDWDLKVTGIFKDLPENSTFWFHALIPISADAKTDQWLALYGNHWDSYAWGIYAEIPPGNPIDQVIANIKDMIKPHFDDGYNPELTLQAMDRWHLHGTFVNGEEAGGKIEYVRLFTWIGVLTLLIACINYMNLSTARSEKRAKEVGIRKSIGSHRSELVVQFLLESFFVTGIAFAIAILLVKLSLPAYDSLVGNRLDLDFGSPGFWLLGAALIVITGLVAGCYPAFYFSSFLPVKVLKGKVQIGKNTMLPRKVLVTTQYVFAIFLVIGMIVIYQQIQHVKSRALGYQQENLLMIACNEEIEKNYRAMKNELLKTAVVAGVTLTGQPIDHDGWNEFVEWNRNGTYEKAIFIRCMAEYDYTKTLGIKILEGRDFSEEITSDSTEVLMNQTAIRLMGFKDPIGQTVKIRGRERTIVGVIEDVLMGSPFDPIKPAFVAMLGDAHLHINIRLSKTSDLPGSLTKVEAVFKKFTSANEFGYQFADERFADKFRTIELIGKLANLFAFLAIFLTGLGVFGLAAYTAEQRTKEMAIRKVLGATARNLIVLVSNYFTRIALFAVVIAAPLSWWALDKYLENYSYRISIPWWTIPLTSVVILLITLLIVTTQVMKAALANPVNSLKGE